jgi:hypothetical protein
MVSSHGTGNQSAARPPSAPQSPFDDMHTSYDSGDLAFQHGDTSPYTPYSPSLASPQSRKEAKEGHYTHLSTPTSTFDTGRHADEESLIGDHVRYHYHNHHVKRFDRNETRRNLWKTGSSQFLVTLLFSALMCICLKAWEGFHDPIVLSKIDIRIFNAVMIGLSLCLGLNLLSSLKHYANTFRWSFLSRKYVSLEIFDLILHSSSLIKVAKLMVVSMPGVRNRKYLRRFGWIRDARNDGTRWMWLVCLLWLSINIASQILVALLSLFWPIEASLIPLMAYGNVAVADMKHWAIDKPDSNATSMEAAWMYGMEAMVYPEFQANESRTDLWALPGMPLYKGDHTWEHRFFNRDPLHQYTNYVASERKVEALATCEQLEVRGLVHQGDSPEVKAFGSMYIEGKAPGRNWTKYKLPQQAAGAVTWITSTKPYCGSRCTNFTVLQNRDSNTIKEPSLFLCNSTLLEPTKAGGKLDITVRTPEDEQSVYGSDDFARIAAGAIGWTGIFWNGWKDRQSRSYTPGSKWSPANVVTTQDVEDMLMRFTIGAVAAFDDHGLRYNLTFQSNMPTQGQHLDVDWPYVLCILCGICGIQFFALCQLVIFANRAIVRDESFFSMAMLLNPVVARIGRAGMNLSGEEIKQHEKLKFKKIRYDYREGREGEPNRVDIFFEGKDQKEGRKSWAPGSYS